MERVVQCNPSRMIRPFWIYTQLQSVVGTMKIGSEIRMKSNVYLIGTLTISLCVLAIASTQGFVAADPCVATLSYPSVPPVYDNANNPVVVPISATCSTNYGTQLYATGNAVDVTSGAGLGTVSTTLSSPDGGVTYNGQLTFNLPPTEQGQPVQISVSIYNGQYGNLITGTSETVQIGAAPEPQQIPQQIVTTTVTQTPNSYPYNYQNPTPYQSPLQAPSNYYPGQLSQTPQWSHHHNDATSHYQKQNPNTPSLFAYVAIFAIVATVIIATVGLLVYARRQPRYALMPVPPPPPPPR